MKTHFKYYNEDGIYQVVNYKTTSHWKYTGAVIAIITAAIVITLLII